MIRIAFLFLSVLLLSAHVELRSQTLKTVTLHVKNKEVREVIDLIYAQTGVSILYDAEQLVGSRRVTVNITNGTIREVLDIITRDQFFMVPDKIPLNVVPRMIYFDGRVLTEDNEPVAQAKITVYVTGESTLTDDMGNFVLPNVYANARVLITSENNYPDSFRLPERPSRVIFLKPKFKELDQVSVIGNTGHERVTYKSIPASVQIIPRESLDQWVSSSVLKQMQGTVSGFQAVNNKIPGINQGREFTNGARNTINSDPNTLIVVDNFPFAGKVSDLNPDDIESITILKDAAAAARWGARAGNGVVVITTRPARYTKPVGLSFNTWTSFQPKPDLHRENLLNAAGQVELQKYLFDHYYYAPLERSETHPALPPVAEILIRKRNREITETEAQAALDELARRDTRAEMEKYFMRTSTANNFSLELSGGSNQFAWLASGSYFLALPEINGSQYQRGTANMINKFRPWKKVELTGRIVHSMSKYQNMDGLPAIPGQDVKLADGNGQPLSYPFGVRSSWSDTAGGDGLVDWRYYPLEEFRLRDRNVQEKNTRISGELRANVLPGLDVHVLYQHQSLAEEYSTMQNKESFYVRNLVNGYTQKTGSQLVRPIPYGNILDLVSNKSYVRNFRALLSYKKLWTPTTGISVYAGREVIMGRSRLTTSKIYDHSDNRPSGAIGMNYSLSYPQFDNPNVSDVIPQAPKGYSTEQNLFSFYGSTNLKFKNTYFFSASGRVDRSNIYRATTRNQSLPLYSLGFAWNLSNERFYAVQWLPELRLRTTYGLSGNTPSHIASVSTIVYAGLNPNGDPTSAINNPMLPSLRWEKVKAFNAGINFAAKNNVIYGSVDWYHRKADDLVGFIPLDNTTGLSYMSGNAAAMASHNIDVVLNAKIVNKALRWNVSLLFSFLKEYVTQNLDTLAQAWQYCHPEYLTVVNGRPLYGIYSFKYRGLDGSGNPIGVFGGQQSQNYDSIMMRRGPGELNYHGRSTPAIFGNLTNHFAWKQFSLSINLRYKFKYYFKRGGVEYYSIINQGEPASGDVALRWRKPGDEEFTNIPALPQNFFLPHNNRDMLYNLSEERVERGDHIRLENIYLEYSLGSSVLQKIRLLSAKIYVNANNIAILWRANDKKIDPDQLTGYIQPCTFSIGIKGNLK